MALAGYPQTHNSPDVLVVTSQNDTTQYEGPFSSIKVMSDSNTEAVTLYLYLDSESYKKTSQVAGTDYYIVESLATDEIKGPIYGFRFHTDSDTGSSVIAYRYSTDVL